MLIDWFTVGAQTLNFIVLVWLMKRFLYRPILRAIDAREQRIASELAGAGARAAAAAASAEDLKQQLHTLDSDRAALMARAVDDSKAAAGKLLDAARAQAEIVRSTQTLAIQRERESLMIAMRKLATTEVFDVARKALADLASAGLEESMVHALIRRLQSLDPASRAALRTAFASTSPAVVSSTVALTDGLKAALQYALNQALSADVKLTFAESPASICGLDIVAGGQKLAWNVADFLSALEHAPLRALKVGTVTPAAAPAA